jgi:hypothetical protein
MVSLHKDLPERRTLMSDKLYTPSNPNAQQGVRNVLKYLSDITYEKIITGQHTQTMAQEELHLIEEGHRKTACTSRL